MKFIKALNEKDIHDIASLASECWMLASMNKVQACDYGQGAAKAYIAAKKEMLSDFESVEIEQKDIHIATHLAFSAAKQWAQSKTNSTIPGAELIPPDAFGQQVINVYKSCVLTFSPQVAGAI